MPTQVWEVYTEKDKGGDGVNIIKAGGWVGAWMGIVFRGAGKGSKASLFSCYIFCFGCLARNTRCNTMSHLTAAAGVSYMSRAICLM